MEFNFDLNTIWFILIGILFAGYAILDGFDLGIGTLHLFVSTDDERRIMLNSIGPVWDGNEVWLVTGGGALFAAFPEVYATVFSGFYNLIIFLLFMIIFRAVAIEFRSKKPMKWWRNTWDFSFCISSILIAFLMGIILGNIITGISVGNDKEYAGTFIELINPYTLLVGFNTVALFLMHGTIYGIMKTEGELQNKLKGWVNNTIIFFILSFAILTIVTLIYYPHMAKHFKNFPPLLVLILINILALANIPEKFIFKESF
jgi:cytochrome d ubiquinol oxidase subunit II